jgi:hypothetical protein
VAGWPQYPHHGSEMDDKIGSRSPEELDDGLLFLLLRFMSGRLHRRLKARSLCFVVALGSSASHLPPNDRIILRPIKILVKPLSNVETSPLDMIRRGIGVQVHNLDPAEAASFNEKFDHRAR